MKKLLVLFTFTFSLFTLCNAQYTDLVNLFGNAFPQGANPYGGMIQSGKILYGMTANGGANADGCIFSLDTNGSNYKDIFDFLAASSGITPYGSLTLSQGKLFGMAENWGPNDSGLIFSIDTNGNNFKDLHDFTGPSGAGGFGTLLLSGKKLYGMAYLGGANDSGCVFTLDTNGNNYKDIFDFNGTNGTEPEGRLVLSGKRMFGLTSAGGTFHYGCIFALDTNGSRYADLYNFDTLNPLPTNSSVTLSGKLLYAAAFFKGANREGSIFSVDTGGGGYRKLFSFNGNDGQNPFCALTLSGNRLFGSANGGGSNGSGRVFAIDTDGHGYKGLVDFDNTHAPEGEYPGELILSGKTLFGTALEGGTFGNGVVFKVDTGTTVLATAVNNLSASAGSVSVYPNPSNGVFSIVIASEPRQSYSIIEVYNTLGEKVYSNTIVHSSSFMVNLNQPAGVYFYRLNDESGNLIGQGKLLIEK